MSRNYWHMGVPGVIWKTKRVRDRRSRPNTVRRGAPRPERLEPRKLLAADPIHVGVVYLETDYLESDQDIGGDSQGDRFILSFTGGAPGTELTELRLRTDKDGDGISVGDPIYDTALGGRGKNGAHGFQVVRVRTAEGRELEAVAEVEDGGQELILRLTNFHAGDRLEFTVDVDEVLRNAVDLEIFNDRLDVITSGQEFQDSILEATFDAPHYEISHADALFVNDFGDPAQVLGLDLPPDQGSDVDSRANRSAAAIASTVQTPKPIEITGQVWLDNDLDAIRENGEQLLAGVELALWKLGDKGYTDTGIRATTDTTGSYVFSKSLGLSPGQYRIVETQPEGMYSVASVPGTIDGQSTGIAESPNVLTDITIPLGDLSAIGYDFAESEPSTLSGFVYQDDNNDGVRDGAESGIAGVRVQLLPINTIAPQSVLTATTSSDGSYSLTGLAPGRYEVIEVDQPANLNDGLDSAGTIHGQTVGVANNPGDRISDVVLAGGNSGLEYNFGEVPFGSIAGFVYFAAPGHDCTGDHEANESTPLPGVELALQTETGTTIARTTTGADGGYLFGALPVGTYRIVEFTPASLIDGSSHVGRIDGLQVGSSVDGGLIQDIVMSAAGVGVEYNFCEAAPASISGYVYHDESDDGIRDANEKPIPGTQVSLIDGAGRIVDTQTTDADGRYRFIAVEPGQYSILETQPLGYLDGIDSVGTIRGQSVGVASGNDSLAAIRLEQGEEATQYNFGELLPAALFGRVHSDVDGDCVLDENEQTLSGITIVLFDASGSEQGRTQTDSQGQYSFENLAPGQYSIRELQPDGFFQGDARAGSAGGDVIDGNRIGNITLASGETAVEYDFCERPPAEISGTVFDDRDGDCIFEPNDEGIQGVRVELYDGDGKLIASTTTDASGNYRFTNLEGGEYTVREIQPTGWLQGGQQAGTAGGDDSTPDVISRIPVLWGERLTQYNFCELEPSSIQGVVFVDGNGDCLQTADEPPLEGVTIELRDQNGRFLATTRTNAQGEYRFENLEPGEYQIFELQPDGYFQGGQSVGTGLGSELGDDLLGLTLSAGEQLTSYNFCELAPSSIRGMVHVDDDGDCIRDPEETSLEGVAIELRDGSGRVVASTTTDANGQYTFDGLAAGEYQIFEQQPDGYFQGGQTFGSGGGQVLGEDLLGLTLQSGQDIVSYNFCELAPSSIAGRVWQEAEPNQRLEPGDVPVPGVLVELIDDGGHVIQETHTDTGGNYRFASLAPGVYSVREAQPASLFHGGQLVGDAGGAVGDDDLIVGIALLGATHATRYDFPEVPPAVISGYVFQDGGVITSAGTLDPKNLRDLRDGVLTTDDARLPGVTLELRNVLGLPFDASRALQGVYADGPIRATSDDTGFYQFTGLRPGTYHVYQSQPEDYLDGLDTPGTSGGVAVNPADELEDSDQITIQTLALSEQTNPHDDAILNIALVGGSSSENNNFSELVVVPPPPPPPPPPPVDIPVAPPKAIESRVATPIETFDPRIRLVTFAQPQDVLSVAKSDDEWAVSWHLSVINGGAPGGEVGKDGIIRGISDKKLRDNWNDGDNANGKWTVVSSNGDLIEMDNEITLGSEGGTALAGDFDGDGIDEAVIYVGGQWFVDLNGNGRWDAGDLWIQLGTELDRPVVGDWDGDGKDDVGIFGRQWQRDPQKIRRDPGLPDPENKRRRYVDSRHLANQSEDRGEDRERLLRRGTDGSLRADAVDHVFQYGEQVDTPIAGDWNADGIDQIGVFRGGKWTLDSNGDGRLTPSDERIHYGRPGDEPIVGDFDGDDIQEIGVVRGDVWIIDTDGDRKITGNDLRIVVPRNSGESQPIVGDFDGDGQDDAGYYDEEAA